MDVPIVTAEHVRQLRAGHPNADLIYAGDAQLRVRSPRMGIVEGEHLYSSQRLFAERPSTAGGLSDDEQAARLNDLLSPQIQQLVARERAAEIVVQLNAYQGNDIWADLIEKLPDLERRLVQQYPDYVRSAYDRRRHDETAATPEFVALGGRVTFWLDRREQSWHADFEQS